MAGVPGSTFLDELNRLANGGSYPPKSLYLSEQGAANIWAGTSGLGLVGALNVKAGTTGMGLTAVCNKLAGTSGFSQPDALRTMGTATFAQHVGGVVTAASPTNAVVTSGVKTTPGNSLIVFVTATGITGQTISSVTDSQGNVYVLDVGPSAGTNLDAVYRSIATKPLGTSDTITVTFSGALATSGAAVWVDEVAGIDAVTPLDTTPTTVNGGVTTTPTAPNITTVTANALVLCACFCGGATTGTFTIGGGYTADGTGITTAGTTTGCGILVGRLTQASPGAVTGATYTTVSHSYQGYTVAYRS